MRVCGRLKRVVSPGVSIKSAAVNSTLVRGGGLGPNIGRESYSEYVPCGFARDLLVIGGLRGRLGRFACAIKSKEVP